MATVDSAGDTRINREIVSQYFTGAYVGLLQSHHRWRTIMHVLRGVVGVAGIALVAVTVRDLFLQTGTLVVWPIPATVMTTPAGLGGILVIAAAVPRLWRYGWELPAAFVVALMIAEVALFNFGDRRIMLLAIGTALAALIAGIYVRVKKRRAPLELRELEPKLDAWTDELIDRFVAANEVPGRVLSHADCRYVVKTFPKLERSGAPRVLGRRGTDGRPRISPIGVGAFVFGPETIVAIEGAIDLRNEEILYRRAHEFRYADVVSLVWTEDAVEAATSTGMPQPMMPKRPLAGFGSAAPEAAVRHRETLEIRLSYGRAVSLVFADSAFLPAERGHAAAASVERRETIRRLWEDLMQRRGPSSAPNGGQA